MKIFKKSIGYIIFAILLIPYIFIGGLCMCITDAFDYAEKLIKGNKNNIEPWKYKSHD